MKLNAPTCDFLEIGKLKPRQEIYQVYLHNSKAGYQFVLDTLAIIGYSNSMAEKIAKSAEKEGKYPVYSGSLQGCYELYDWLYKHRALTVSIDRLT